MVMALPYDVESIFVEVVESGGRLFTCPAEELEVYFRDGAGEIRSSLEQDSSRVAAVRLLKDLIIVDWRIVNMVKMMLDAIDSPKISEKISVSEDGVVVYMTATPPSDWSVLAVRVKDVLFHVQTSAQR